ncbi:MAG TPA: hypothetical protein VG872_02035 [Acidimicrobiia bacterium]|jgi:hypothetical protein|nr:hypothetical protein [Acidimicrobiia bacterium]
MEEQFTENMARVVLYWIPLGAGGALTVRVSGRVYESVQALLEHRRALDLYHTALQIDVGGDHWIVENAWPSPDDDIASRGVVSVGPVWSRRLERFRLFRYEVRCWRDGIISDVEEAVTARTLGGDAEEARHLLALVRTVPVHAWGRKPSRGGEMWNSNSVISYLLAISGFPAAECRPPDGGRAPGWDTGIRVAGGLTERQRRMRTAPNEEPGRSPPRISGMGQSALPDRTYASPTRGREES